MPVKAEDVDGQVIQAYVAQFSRWTNVKPLRGGEAVMQARLQSRSPAILTVLADPDTRRITSEWKATIDGREYAMKADAEESEDWRYLSFLAEAKAVR